MREPHNIASLKYYFLDLEFFLPAALFRVDFLNVQEQASWVCGCNSSLVFDLEQDFKDTLSQQVSLECWAEWLEGVADRVLKAETKENYATAAKQFLLR